MRLTIELDNKYVSIEIGDLEDDDPVSITEDEYVRLPIGFQPPPDTEDIDDDDEAEEIDACRGEGSGCPNGTLPEVPEVSAHLRGGRQGSP